MGIKLKVTDTQEHGDYQREEGWGVVKGKGAKYTVMEDDWTLGGGRTLQYTDHVS